MINAGMMTSSTDLWETPQDFFDKLDAEFGFDLDVCALSENAKCKRYYTPKDDGLLMVWEGVCWMNPPYGRLIGRWVEKAYHEAKCGRATVVCLLPFRSRAFEVWRVKEQRAISECCCCVLCKQGGCDMTKPILDVCCGSRMFWFDKENPAAVFMDNRSFAKTLCDGRRFEVNPDLIADFREIPFSDESFRLVVFDPPHLCRAGKSSWLGIKYGVLESNWQEDLRRGFEECMRVLKDYGVLVFKWSEDQITTADVLKLLPEQPLFGNRRGKTIWLPKEDIS